MEVQSDGVDFFVFVFVVLFDVFSFLFLVSFLFSALFDAVGLFVVFLVGVSVSSAGVLVDAVCQLAKAFPAVLSPQIKRE